MRTTLSTLALLGTIGLGTGAQAEEHEVKMLNRGEDGQRMVFEPAHLKIEPGDTVNFVPTDKSHNAESILGMIPEGAEAFKGKINQEVSITFDEIGLYGVKCMPHYAMGMVALIEVGDELPNLDQAMEAKNPGQAAARMALLLNEVGQEDASGSDAADSGSTAAADSTGEDATE
ncbi:pseudoazurin [Pararhodobacter marinus]|uniref:pseudoazurin n=1 Tax=Pararhodobacter marinus TaxID=2184063 RepID=UPI003518FC23